MRVCVRYGQRESFEQEVPTEQVVAFSSGPRAEVLANFAGALEACLDDPLAFPPLRQMVVPGDRVVMALDEALPDAPVVVRLMMHRLAGAGVRPADVTLLQPAASSHEAAPPDPRAGLPSEWRNRVHWETAQPQQQEQFAYLASTAKGHRVYLHRRLVEADVVLPIAALRFDPALRYAGTNHVIYPALASEAAQRRQRKSLIHAIDSAISSNGKPVQEDRAQSSTDEADEVAWLLGVQFVVGMIALGPQQCAHVLAGEVRAVFERGKQLVENTWKFPVPQRADVVVAGVPGSASCQSLTSLAAALAAAQRVVKYGGSIVLLTEVSDSPGSGVRWLANATEAERLVEQLRREPPADVVDAQRIAAAVSWAHVYLKSTLDPQLVEDLSMTPLDASAEVARLLARGGSAIFLNDAHHLVPVIENP